jgi:uncharacterized YigZ family protein
VKVRYRTIAAEVRHEPEPIQRSRHPARALPLASESDVAKVLAEVASDWPSADHHAFAWRLSPDGRRYRCSDDGEPSGCAGKPILQQLERLDLTHVLVVVTRIFGGVKLGTGGLIRAYGGAAAAVLEQAAVVERAITAGIAVEHSYEDSVAVQSVLRAPGIWKLESDYGESVRSCFDVAVDEVDAWCSTLREVTAGRIQLEVRWPDGWQPR